jgi:hypothetical protein
LVCQQRKPELNLIFDFWQVHTPVKVLFESFLIHLMEQGCSYTMIFALLKKYNLLILN